MIREEKESGWGSFAGALYSIIRRSSAQNNVWWVGWWVGGLFVVDRESAPAVSLP